MKSHEPLSTNLTAAQRSAAHHPSGPLLILAGPGAGKTRVLVYRIAHFVEVRHIEPERVLALTFTHRAAGELRVRLTELLGAVRAARVCVSTFHAFGLRLLREHAHTLDLPGDFSILGPAEQQNLMAHLLRAYGGDTAAFTSRDLLAEVSRAKQHLRTPMDLARHARSEVHHIVADLYAAYQASLSFSSAFDLDDLNACAVELLRGHPAIRRTVRRQHPHVLVDEGQDINTAQYALLRALIGPTRDVTVVADDDQAIYGWRGASVRHLHRFRSRYSPTVVQLDVNHRSTARIVAAASAVVTPCEDRFPKDLRAAPSSPQGRHVRVLEASDARDEAERIVARLHHHHVHHGIGWESMAVLYRTRDQSRGIAQALLEADIPHRIAHPLRTEDDVAALARAYLRIAATRHPDDAAVLATLACQPGIGATTLQRLIAGASARRAALYATLKGEHIPALSKSQARALTAYLARARDLRRAHRSAASLPGAVDAVLRHVEFANATRIELVAHATTHARAHPNATLVGYLDASALLAAASPPPDGDAVTLITMHGAKGLEFDAVVVAGVEVGLVPHGVGECTSRETDEERRLLYVAMTRARHHLTLTYAQWRYGRDGALGTTGPSPFLANLPSAMRRR
jgi:DNA helicase-2/ATP-dependent DNA helicase PcrA